MPNPTQQRCCILCVCCECGSAGQIAALAAALEEYDTKAEEGDFAAGKEPRYQRMARRLVSEFRLVAA